MTGSTRAGQWYRDGADVRSWFDSGSRALDFMYSDSVLEASRAAIPTALSDWLSEHWDAPVAPAQERDIEDAIRLRGAIFRLAQAASAHREFDGSDIDVINLYAAVPDIPPRLTGGTLRAGRSIQTVAHVLASIAREAVELLGPGNANRVKKCSADDCDMIYLDTSRASNRRWCSMQRCGNREKVRTHRARHTGLRAHRTDSRTHTNLAPPPGTRAHHTESRTHHTDSSGT